MMTSQLLLYTEAALNQREQYTLYDQQGTYLDLKPCLHDGEY